LHSQHPRYQAFTAASAEAGPELAEAKRTEIERDMRSFFEDQERDAQGIWAPTSSWVISARNPG
jgi:hypothetical protein